MIMAIGHADHIIDLNLAAGAHAQTALNTGIQIDTHGGMTCIHIRCFSSFGKAAGCDANEVSLMPEI